VVKPVGDAERVIASDRHERVESQRGELFEAGPPMRVDQARQPSAMPCTSRPKNPWSR
jgi:hypothetical protein